MNSPIKHRHPRASAPDQSRTKYKVKRPAITSSPKLLQMMVQMFVHPPRPLLRRQRPEKTMRMLRASSWPTCSEAVNQSHQPFPFHHKFPLIANHKALVRRRVALHRLLVQEIRLRDRPQQPPNKDPRRTPVPNRTLHRHRAMRQHLRRIHLAPRSLAIPAQGTPPFFQLNYRRRIKKISHAERSPPLRKFLCPDNISSRVPRLVRSHVVNRARGGQQNSDSHPAQPIPITAPIAFDSCHFLRTVRLPTRLILRRTFLFSNERHGSKDSRSLSGL